MTQQPYLQIFDALKSNRHPHLSFVPNIGDYERILLLGAAVQAAGGTLYFVGGMVRDYILGLSKNQPYYYYNSTKKIDYDFCVAGLAYEKITEIIKEIATFNLKIDEVGKSFGILMINNFLTKECQISIPRFDTDRNVVSVDPSIPIEKDLQRRDFTINAFAIEIAQPQRIIAPNKTAENDGKKKILKAVGNADDRFAEDPLRILRALQFVARYKLKIDPKTSQAMKRNAPLLHNISKERFEAEFYKGCVSGDYNTFVNCMKDHGIDKELFGDDFKPIIINKDDDDSEFPSMEKVWLPALFFNGGDFTKITDKNEWKALMHCHQCLHIYFYDKSKENMERVHSSARKVQESISEYVDLCLHVHQANKEIIDIFDKPLFHLNDTYAHTWILRVSGDSLIKAFTDMKVPVPYKDFSKIFASLAHDIQHGRFLQDYKYEITPDRLIEHFKEKKYK